jgi:hypothetical protein
MTPEISQRQRTVAAMKVDAVELTARAEDEWIKGEVRKAVRDLDEALSWMRPKAVGASTVLLIADVAISAAAGRLRAIKEVLARYGDQAETIWVSRSAWSSDHRLPDRVPVAKRRSAE